MIAHDSSDSTKMGDLRVVLVGRRIFVSDGTFWSHLTEIIRERCLWNIWKSQSKPLTDLTITQLTQWAQARGFKARHVIKQKKDRRRIAS